MITIADVLTPHQLNLNLKATTSADAILEVCELLKSDDRVTDWVKFYGSLKSTNACVSDEQGAAVCIPHARTDSVHSMVMAAGRSVQGIEDPLNKVRIHWIFVIGVPVALASDYLRIIGALARIFRSSAVEMKLRNAISKSEFMQLLQEQELRA